MKIIKKIGKIIGIFILIIIIGMVGLYGYCYITPKMDINKSQSYYLYDNKEEMVFNNNNKWISLDKISPYLIDATISTEDKHFYHHIGFDSLRIAKALVTNIVSSSLSEGASTITQQYARNLFLNYDKTWERKIDEAMLAIELEVHYTKDEILEGYLNTINYGGIFGIENASWYYFNKSASDLTLAEASMLAGIPQAPAKLSPINNEENAKKRQNVVLELMVNNKKITENDKTVAYNTPLEYVGKTDDNDITSLLYYRDAVIEELNGIETIPSSLIKTGGLKIYTTLNKEAQVDLENAVKNNIKDGSELQLAGIMIDPNNGEVMALLGGTDYSKSQYNRAIKAKRQVGSTMKPFLYYAALESGFTSASSFISEATTFYFANNKTYSPKNYNNHYANGPLSMTAAIAYSDNIFAVKTHLFLGEETLVNMVNRLGISSNMSAIPSLALGTKEISLMEMVCGYGAFASQGYKVDSHFIKRVEDSKGNIIYEYKEEKDLILNPSLTYILSEMLTSTYDTAFISYNYPTLISLLPKITHKYSIKTGTTDSDMLIIGYNKNAVLGIWTGYDDNRKIDANDYYLHKDVWIDTMETYLKDKDNSWYSVPSNIVGVLVDPITGMLAKEDTKVSKMFYFIKGTEPTAQYVNYDLDAAFKEDIEGNRKE